jgi:hypothetical protein
LKYLTLENKERTRRAAREKHQLAYKGKHIRITSVLLAQILKARKTSNNIFKLWERTSANQEYCIQQSCQISVEK